MRHYVTGPIHWGGLASYQCSCGWESTWTEDPEVARLESCRHLATVLRFGAVTIAGDDYLVPQS